MKHNICTLEFFITSVNVLTMVVDTDKKVATVTHISHKKSASPILPEKERHYAGLERRLQIYMQSQQPLPVLIDEIDRNGIHVDYHDNLNINVVY